MRYQAIDTQTGEVTYESNLPPTMWRTPRQNAPKRRNAHRQYLTRFEREVLFLGSLTACALATVIAMKI